MYIERLIYRSTEDIDVIGPLNLNKGLNIISVKMLR